MDILTGRRKGLGPTLLRGLLTTASYAYAAVTWLRRRAYRAGWLPSYAVDVPVISVGNITTGGTGKTPMVAWLVEQLRSAGRTPAVLTRGYHADSTGRSDEAEMLRESTGAMVVVNPNRVAGASAAIEKGADVLVLDDGFQHRRLRRDLDIVLVDATNPFGLGRLLPRGLLREPLSSLAAADVIVVTRSDQLPTSAMEKLLTGLGELAPDAVVTTAVHRPVAIVDDAGTVHPPEIITARKLFAFCGIANPEAFFVTLRELGAEVVGRQDLPDHVEYSDVIVGALTRACIASPAAAAVTTEKDAVKLAEVDLGIPLWKLRVQMSLTDDGRDVLDAVARVLVDRAPSRSAPPAHP